jgi:hypothetical protein
MEQVQPESKSLVGDIAKSWGTSRAYVYKLAKKGCPVDSIEAASDWRSANAKLGVGYRSRGAGAGEIFLEGNDEGMGGGAGVAEQPTNWGAGPRKSYAKTRVNVKTIERSLKQAIEIERMAAEVVEAAQSNPEKLVTAINAYNKALANRMDAEKRVLEYQQARKLLIPLDAAKDLINRAWVPLLARLRSAPKRAAMKANPSDDTLAEEVFSEEIESAIAEGQASYAAVFA